MNVQKSNSAIVMNATRGYDGGRTGALLLITSDDPATSDALETVFRIHEAPRMSPEFDLPWDLEDVGDCVISQDGVVLAIEGKGGVFMGLKFETYWGVVDEGWRREAERNGCAWLALTPFEDYRTLGGVSGALIPEVPVLKLTVAP